MNMEASALVQSWPGVEGTQQGDTTHVDWHPAGHRRLGADPASRRTGIAVDGTVPPRRAGLHALQVDANQEREAARLPRHRSATVASTTARAATPARVQVSFEPGYLPSVDGCMIGTQDPPSGGRRAGAASCSIRAGQRRAPSSSRELARATARPRKRAVPERLIVGDDANGDPVLNQRRPAHRRSSIQPAPRRGPNAQPATARSRQRVCGSATPQQVTLAGSAADPPDRGLHRLGRPLRGASVPTTAPYWMQPEPGRGVLRRHGAALPERAGRVLVELPDVPDRDLVQHRDLRSRRNDHRTACDHSTPAAQPRSHGRPAAASTRPARTRTRAAARSRRRSTAPT